MDSLSKFSEKFVELMQSENKTANQMAEILNTDESTVSRWKEGKMSIKLSKAILIADHFKCSLEYLFGLTDEFIDFDLIWFDVLKELDRLEYNDCHRENRKHVSYEKLELLNDFLIPKELSSDENSPPKLLESKEEQEAKYILYDKILRECGFLTKRQFAAFQYRVLCGASFKQAVYFMRFECDINESEQLTKKHYYNAIKQLQEHFAEDYKKLKDFLENR